jgi:hypothetical protein
VGVADVKCGDTSGGTTKASRMPNYTGMTSGMAEATRIVENHVEMVESS